MNPDKNIQLNGKNFPRLQTPLKKRFPFRLSAPSFVYPADYVTNVSILGPYLDEIELLLFESQQDSLPTEKDIEQLAGLQKQVDITYNIHLPLDLDLSAPDTSHTRYAIQQIAYIAKMVRCLCPTTYTLHLKCDLKRDASQNQIADWQRRTRISLEKLLPISSLKASQISVETLSYPPQWFEPIVGEFDLSVCIDVGHILRYGYDLNDTLHHFSGAITIIHLHGVEKGRDHDSIDKLSSHSRSIMKNWLDHFKGTVSLELFAPAPLQKSMDHLAEMMHIPVVPSQTDLPAQDDAE